LSQVKEREILSAQYVHIKRKKYACGLLWQPMVAGFTTRAYAYKLSRGIDRRLNLYVAYNGMIGLGARANGLRSGMPSVAIEIINSLPGYASMLGVFQVDGKFVLVAIRNGVILYDLLFTDEEEARAKYAELSEIPDWNALFAPAVWGMPRAVERDLADMFGGTNHGVLRPISRFGAGMLSVLMLVAFAFLFLYAFHEPLNQVFAPKPQIAKINPKLAEEYKRQVEEKNKELDEQYNLHQEKVLEPLVMPFDSLPDAMERAELCYRAIGFLMQPVTGWNQVSAECDEKYAVATFKRSFGTLEDFYVLVANSMPGVFVQEINDDEISVRAKLPPRGEYSSQDERDAETVVRDLTSRFQAINLDATTSVVVDMISNDTQSAEVYVVEISAVSKLIPTQFMQIFDGFGGIYMTKALWNAKRKTWNYEVIIYAK
jgi:hypothetical protein